MLPMSKPMSMPTPPKSQMSLLVVVVVCVVVLSLWCMHSVCCWHMGHMGHTGQVGHMGHWGHINDGHAGHVGQVGHIGHRRASAMLEGSKRSSEISTDQSRCANVSRS